MATRSHHTSRRLRQRHMRMYNLAAPAQVACTLSAPKRTRVQTRRREEENKQTTKPDDGCMKGSLFLPSFLFAFSCFRPSLCLFSIPAHVAFLSFFSSFPAFRYIYLSLLHTLSHVHVHKTVTCFGFLPDVRASF